MHRHVDVEHLRRLKVDCQYELDRPLHGKLARLCPLEDAISIDGCTPEIIDLLASVGQEAASGGKRTEGINRRNTKASGQQHDLLAMAVGECIRHYDE